MGITYKALDTHLGCPVALKIINARRLIGNGARERFLREARTAASLRHPNIASVFHLGLGEENCYYAMEYIEGETLDARVQREGALPYRIALDIVGQGARALRAAHAQHFIHRDIKPTNIMLSAGEHRAAEDAPVKLIDFGLVKAVRDGAMTDFVSDGYFAGTPHYASPEQLEGRTVDARSDIYSLGMCLGYILTGKHPRPAPQSADAKSRSYTRRFLGEEMSKDIPASVVTLLGSMVSSDPALRPQTAEELSQRVAACLTGVESDANASTVAGRNVIPLQTNNVVGRRTKILLCAGLLVAATLITLSSKSWTKLGKQPERAQSSNEAGSSVEARVQFAQGIESFRKHSKADNQFAIDHLSKAITLSPSYAEAHAVLASVYFENVSRFSAPADQLDLAITSAQRAIALDSNNTTAFQVLGAIRSFQGQPWEALVQLHHALEFEPTAAKAMCDFSLLWICVGKPQFALPWARRAAQIEPSNIQGLHAAAEASVEMCDDAQAEEYYRRCIELRPLWMSGHCGLIHLHLLQGDFARARQDCSTAESIQSGLLLPSTLKAHIAFFSGNFDEAETIFRYLLTQNRNGLTRYYSGISYLSAMGFLRLRAGDATEGQGFLEEAEKLHPPNSEGPEDVYDLAAIRAIQGRKEEALLLLSQAIDSGWNDYRAMQLDPRLDVLRKLPDFQNMLGRLKLHVAQMREEATALCKKPLNLEDYPVRPPDKVFR